MSDWTNKGRFLNLDWNYRGSPPPTNLYVALVTSATAPTDTINILSELTQIAAGNGYTDGGFQLTRNTTDFDVINEDDTNNSGSIQVKDVVWSASGGSIPASGGGARYAVLTTDSGTVGNREVLGWWDLAADRVVTTGQDLTLQNLELRITSGSF